MSHMLEISEPIVSTEELHGVLEQLLTDYFRWPRKIVRMDRRPSDYYSSFPIEELTLKLEDESVLNLIFKNLNRDTLLENGRRAKPWFIYNPRREIEVYRNVLPQGDLGTATFYGAVENDKAHRHWLFIEKVAGLELYQIGDFAVWQQVARWLARMHIRFAGEASERREHLLKHDADFYRTWIRRVEEFSLSEPLPRAGERTKHGIERLIGGYHKVVERLMALPQTLVHGEFYASNVLIQERAEGLRVCPVDWEMAAVGPGLTDLAALTAGKWSDEQKTALALAYHSEVKSDPNGADDPDQFLVAFDYCRLQQAVQWLGWFGRRRPYSQHAQDWIGEAMRLADKLGL